MNFENKHFLLDSYTYLSFVFDVFSGVKKYSYDIYISVDVMFLFCINIYKLTKILKETEGKPTQY